MRLLPDQPDSLPAATLICRPSRIVASLGIWICLLFVSAGAFMINSAHAFFGWYIIIVSLLFTSFFMRSVARAFSRRSWLLRVSSDYLYIHIDPLFTPASAAPTILQLDNADIAWIRAYRKTVLTTDDSDRNSETNAFLEIKPRATDLAELRDALNVARAPTVTKRAIVTSTRYPILLISVTAEGIIRLQWQSIYARITPPLDSIITALGKTFPVQPAITEVHDFTKTHVNNEKMDQQIVEFVEQGRNVDAIRLARLRYGFSLAQAHQFVDELQGGIHTGTKLI